MPIHRQRIRVPRSNHTALHHPPLSESGQLIRTNQSQIAQQSEASLSVPFLNVPPADLNFSSLQAQARQSLLKLARGYSGLYLNPTAVEVDFGKTSPIVMSGHQPELYHPGVWYKNFVLSELARRENGIAVNLVIDSDLATQNSIRYPDLNSAPARTGSIDVDTSLHPVPHEIREIGDWEFFEAFATRVQHRSSSWGNEPERRLIVDRLWPEVLAAAKVFLVNQTAPKMGASLAAGRHRLEQKIGLKTLEVPFSQVATMESFAIFAAAVFDRSDAFLDTYNASLDEYRTAHRIRSRSHPVPALGKSDNWTEVPFWIYQSETKIRQPLFIQSKDRDFLLSDLNSPPLRLSKKTFVEEFRSLSSKGIFIRPRALTTTLFSRLFLSDVFIHGIGGAKYDLLTDEICRQFFNYRLPAYMTASATMTLPTNESDVSPADIAELRHRRRELRYHPELFIEAPAQTPNIAALIQKKKHWTAPAMQSVRSQEKHDSIETINQNLRSHTIDLDESLQYQINAGRAQLRRSQLAGSREYSFCLFDSQLIENLQKLASSNFACVHGD